MHTSAAGGGVLFGAGACDLVGSEAEGAGTSIVGVLFETVDKSAGGSGGAVVSGDGVDLTNRNGCIFTGSAGGVGLLPLRPRPPPLARGAIAAVMITAQQQVLQTVKECNE